MMSDLADIRNFAERLSAAAEAGDLVEVAKFYHPDATLWFNTTGQTRTITEHLASVGTLRANIRNRRWIDMRITPFENGYVQQWRTTAEGSDGKAREMPVCMVCHLRDGKIARREEYHDAAQLAALRS